ncbi:MAG: cation:proton antiporter, partial [Thermoplasmata archaeon]
FNLADWLGIDLFSSGNQFNLTALQVFFYIGLIFLVFAIGLRIGPAAVRAVARKGFEVAVVGVAVPVLLGIGFLLIFVGDSSVYSILFVSSALAASSLGIVTLLVHEKGLVDEAEGHLLLTAAFFEDVIAFILLAIFIALADHGSPVDPRFLVQVGLVVAFAIVFIVGFLVFGEKIGRAGGSAARRFVSVLRLENWSKPDGSPTDRAKGTMLAFSLLVCLGAGYRASSFELAAILGTFFAGMALSGVAARYGTDHAFDALNALFVPFFFVYIGLFLNAALLAPVWLLAVVITAIAVAGKILAGLAHTRSLGRRGALSLGTALTSRGEVGVVIAVAATSSVGAGVISPSYAGAIIVMAIATTVIGPILF